ncbi:MAG: FmdB family zinc ribbon protein, partial [Mycobacteriales bacterium]
MPTYQYVCTECGQPLEVVQSFTDAPLEVCPQCQGRLRKVFSAGGVVFKGSGFYKTDSRVAAKPKSDTSVGGEKPAETKTADKSSTDKSEAPAASAKPSPSP